MAYPFRVLLTEAQRAVLRTLIGSGTAPARMLIRARILLKANHSGRSSGWSAAGTGSTRPERVPRPCDVAPTAG